MEWTVAVGIDTHKDTHVAVAFDQLGRQLDALEIEATEAGYQMLWRWARGLGRCAFSIERSGGYGAGLARFLGAAGAAVYECERPQRRERRRGKNDYLDAALAAGRLLAGEGLGQPRGGGKREDLRVLLVERRSAVQARAGALNQLHARVVTAPSALRERLSRLHGAQLARAAMRLRKCHGEEELVLVPVLRRLGRRAQALSRELQEIDGQIEEIVKEVGPDLLAETGVGVICAAQLVVSSGDPARMRTEASFAALAGTSPLDASSGRQQRHRLNRGGDRQLNWALHVIALHRIRHHTQTACYYAKLLEGGKSKREAIRCVKRVLARYFYRKLRAIPALHLTP